MAAEDKNRRLAKSIWTIGYPATPSTEARRFTVTPQTIENREPKLRAEEWLDDLIASAERRVQMLTSVRQGLRPRGRRCALSDAIMPQASAA